MPGLEQVLIPEQCVILAVDTSEEARARQLAGIARSAGASIIKEGLEISSATSWATCADIAAEAELDWVADAKIDDIPNTTAGIVRNLAKLSHPPLGITVHCNSGVDSMRAAQEIAGETGITILGVTHLTSIDEKETKSTYRFLRHTLVRRRLDKALEAGIEGYVSSPLEVKKVVSKHQEYQGLYGMIPGARSKEADSHDQKNTDTPFAAMLYGASGLVIGRQVTGSADPAEAFMRVTREIGEGIDARNQQSSRRAA